VRAPSNYVAAVPPRSLMNSHRFISARVAFPFSSFPRPLAPPPEGKIAGRLLGDNYSVMTTVLGARLMGSLSRTGRW
jgi:hypothetical protein